MAALVWALGVATPAPAQAEELDKTSVEDSHKGQFGLSARFGTGYRGIFPFDDAIYCGDPDSVGELCLGRSPVFVDLGASYRVLDQLELLVEMRVGIEADFGANASTDGESLRVYAPGIRAYLRDAGLLKLFLTLQFTIDTTSYPQAPDTDYGVRLTPGVMLDPHKTVGIMFFFGPAVTWSRWLKFEMEGGLGIQARFP
ncbi:MAG TPA: hypothetical protein VML75_23245 [Kofleriaceae bacterium]|nr:hypothetical protein [Kofleriaceae bacterium]